MVDEGEDFDHFTQGARFGEERVGAEFVSSVDVVFQAGVGHDDGWDDTAGLMIEHPFEDFKAVQARHFQVQQHASGKGVF